jgi:hypothetical protein
MGKYSASNFQKPKEKVQSPLWQGIGCMLMIIVPLFSFGLAYAVIDMAFNTGWPPLPYEWVAAPTVPGFITASPELNQYLGPILGAPGFWGIIIFTVIFTIIVGALVSFIYAIIQKYMGPSMYGPTDIAPEHRKIKKYTR